MGRDEQTVFIVDDDEDVRDGLKELVESVGLQARVYDSAGAFLNELDRDQGGCLILDVRMPGMSGLELQQRLNAQHSIIPVIMITGHGDVPMAVQAMKEGAREFLQKPFRDQDLLDCISKALERDEHNRRELQEQQLIQERIEMLTERERQIVDSVLDGKPNKVIARELGISDRTVEIHRSHAMQKMKANSVAHLVQMMIRARD